MTLNVSYLVRLLNLLKIVYEKVYKNFCVYNDVFNGGVGFFGLRKFREK